MLGLFDGGDVEVALGGVNGIALGAVESAEGTSMIPVVILGGNDVPGGDTIPVLSIGGVRW